MNYVKKKEEVPLYLIVPVLNEQRIIEETYMHFRDIVNQFEKVYVVYVTTEKEGPCSITTYEMIKRLMEADVCNKKYIYFIIPIKRCNGASTELRYRSIGENKPVPKFLDWNL